MNISNEINQPRCVSRNIGSLILANGMAASGDVKHENPQSFQFL